MTAEPPQDSLPADDIERLREENARLRADLEAGASQRVPRRRVRRTAAAVLAFLTALLLVLGVVAGWTSRTALNTDAFVSRVGPVIEDPTVRATVATQLGDQLVTALDLQTRIAQVLPENLTFLAGPMSSAANDVVRKQVTRFVNSDAFIKVWYAALRLSHTQVVHALTGSSSDQSLVVVNGKVAVDLIGVIGQVLDQLPAQLPTVVGAGVASHIPDNLPLDQVRSLVSRFLGVDLPPDFALVPLVDKSALDSARQGVKVINLSIILVLLLSLVSLLLALVASVDRRRTILQVGLWVAVVTATLTFAVRAVVATTVSEVDPTWRPALTSGIHELFSSLRGWATFLFWLGLVLAVVLYLAGPGRGARRVRGWVGAGTTWTNARVHEVAADEGVASWTAGHLDALRIGGVVVAALALVWWTSWTALAVVGVLLVLYEVGVTLYARSTPSAGTVADDEDSAPVAP